MTKKNMLISLFNLHTCLDLSLFINIHLRSLLTLSLQCRPACRSPLGRGAAGRRGPSREQLSASVHPGATDGDGAFQRLFIFQCNVMYLCNCYLSNCIHVQTIVQKDPEVMAAVRQGLGCRTHQDNPRRVPAAAGARPKGRSATVFFFL